MNAGLVDGEMLNKIIFETEKRWRQIIGFSQTPNTFLAFYIWLF